MDESEPKTNYRVNFACERHGVVARILLENGEKFAMLEFPEAGSL
jgi:hypothetical protein